MTEELVSGPLLPDEQLVVDSFKMFIRESEFKQGMPVHVAKCKLADGRLYEILFAKSHPRIAKSAKNFHLKVDHPKHGQMKCIEEVWTALLEDFPMRPNLMEALIKLVNSTGGTARGYYSNGSYWFGNKKWSVVWQCPDNPFLVTHGIKRPVAKH